VGTIRVDLDNFVRAETNRMFAAMAGSGGVNRWRHTRVPIPIDQQTVIRMNRDTLYSSALIDLAEGATVTVPDAGGRYLSVMVVNQDHYINRILHDPGEHELGIDEFDTRYVIAVARVLADPADPDDLAVANRIQDGLGVTAASAEPFVLPDYDEESFTAVRDAVLRLGAFSKYSRAFGRKDDVDPVQHLVGTATGWGGLPETEATYVNLASDLAPGEYRIEVPVVPVDAFWSISVYNADGFFEPNERDAYSVNDVTGTKHPDGSMTVHLGGCDDGRENCVPLPPRANVVARLYRPRPEVLDGSWTFPTPEAVDR
jgi:hypothetical protein